MMIGLLVISTVGLTACSKEESKGPANEAVLFCFLGILPRNIWKN